MQRNREMWLTVRKPEQQSIETDPKMAQRLDLADLAGREFKAASINIFKEPKEHMVLMRKQLRNLRREMETIKKSQV